jgi:NAD+ synthase (glutamine-hydrolysing)
MIHYGFVKCGIATINGKLSNIKENTNRIKKIVSQAENQNVKILIFPELSLTGYTCQDLFHHSQLIEEVNLHLKELVEDSSKKDVLFVVGAPIDVNDTLYNCAVAIHNGKIIGIVPKQYIPNYNEFYEKRWFTPYTDFSINQIEILGEKVPFGNIIFSSNIGYQFGIEICEDLWSVIPPSSYLALAGANIIANLSASNELVGKENYRYELIKNQSARTISAYLYTAAGFSESTSDIVFGGSGYVFENGKELIKAERYQMEDIMKIVDIDVEYLSNERRTIKTFSDSKKNLNFPFTVVKVQHKIESEEYKLTKVINPNPFIPDIMDEEGGKTCKEIISIQATALARRLDAIHGKSVTIGISGGLDSSWALIVCYEAFKKLGLDVKGIMGITMPGFGTSKRTYHNAVKLGEILGITMQEISIKEACMQHFKDINYDPSIHDVTYENVQARERTKILMNMANKNNSIVIGTGDLSELVLGWCTYNGDHMSMYNINCSIPKTLVKYLIEWYAKYDNESQALREVLMDIIDTPISPELLPSDGEEISQKTENTVGPYEVLDFFIFHFLRNKFSREKILFLAKNAYQEKYTKEQLEQYYNGFIKRFFQNQFKRNCIPDGPKVGSVSVSPRGDLRMPSDADYINW